MSQTSGFPQTSPGQFQPAYPQAIPGQQFQQTPQGQPGQHYGQPGQHYGQPGQYYGQPGQPIQAVGQQAQPGQRPNQRRPTTPPTTAYWRSAFIADKLVEFFILLAAWICIVRYSDVMFIADGRTNFFSLYKADGRINFFKGITIFSWLMVILLEVAFVFVSIITQRFFSRPRDFTAICLVVQIILTILLIACSAYLVPLAHDHTKLYDFLSERGKTTLITLYLALIFGFFACLCFLDDIRHLYKMIGTQKAEEQAVIRTEPQQMVGSFSQPVPVETGVNSHM